MASYFGELLVLAGTAIFAVMAYGMKLGNFQQPGAGMWPFILCITILVLAVVAGLENYRLQSRAKFHLATMRNSLLAIVSIAVYAFAMERLGYVIPTLLLLGFWLRVIGGEGWKMTAILSFAVTALFYLVFSYFLGVPLPAEIFLD